MTVAFVTSDYLLSLILQEDSREEHGRSKKAPRLRSLHSQERD